MARATPASSPGPARSAGPRSSGRPRSPSLIAVAHGTTDAEGTAEVRRLIDLVRAERPHVRVELCWIERAEPLLSATLAGLEGPAVVVPVLLSTGYHVKLDLPAIVGARPATVLCPPLGPDKRISRVVYLRLQAARRAATEGGGAEVGHRDAILIGAGSSDPQARAELAEVARHLTAWSRSPISIGQLTDDDPFRAGRPAADVANYLLAPGFFNDRLHRLAASWAASGAGASRAEASRAEASGAGASRVGASKAEASGAEASGVGPIGVVADPVGAHPLVAEVIWDRYDTGVSCLSSAASSRMP